MLRRSSRVSLVIVLILVACGGPSTEVRHGEADGPPPVSAENFHEVQRAYLRMDPADPARIAWRDALIAHLAASSEALLAAGDYDAVVAHLARLTRQMTPADVGAQRVPSGFAPLALWVVEHGSARGDEGRVMGAHRLLEAMGEDADAHRQERERIAAWGREARAGIANPIERFGDLIQVWEQYEQVAPSPEVLDMLARLYLEQRDALRLAFGPESQSGATPGLTYSQVRLAPLLIERAPLDVAAVFLRHGDLSGAITHVSRIEPSGERDARLVAQLIELLEQAQADTPRGAEALGELADGFSRARPEISAAVCQNGVRRFATDARFPLCLARSAYEGSRAAAATAWYAEAVRLAPDEREVYDEALQRLAEIMEAGAFAVEVGQSRALARSALSILREHAQRWPNEEPVVTTSTILLQLGRAEMSAGNVVQAREQFVASLAADESRAAHIQLGLLLQRLGDGAESATHFREALDQTPERGPEGIAQRAELTERLGDAFRQAGEDPQALRMYRQALAQWDGLLSELRGPQVAMAQVRRGILLSRLGDASASAEAFVAALESHPAWREPYAAILAHLVVSEPNLELAQAVLHRAQFQLHLEPTWKVYFALWVQAVAGRASEELSSEVAVMLGDLARGDAWSNRLAAFGDRSLAYPELREHASNRGERVEADFYEGARRLASGDRDGARELLEQVIESGMVNFYEYAMAQEILRDLSSGGSVAAAAR